MMKAQSNFAPSEATPPGFTEKSGNVQPLAALVRRDQLAAICRSVQRALPVSALLGVICLSVAIRHGRWLRGAVWFGASSVANVWRAVLCHSTLTSLVRPKRLPVLDDASLCRKLRSSGFGALLSGLVWGGVPVLCSGYTTAQTLFYLIVACGISAGAVTHGT